MYFEVGQGGCLLTADIRVFDKTNLQTVTKKKCKFYCVLLLLLLVVRVPALLNRPASLHTSQVGVQTDRKDEVVFTKSLLH